VVTSPARTSTLPRHTATPQSRLPGSTLTHNPGTTGSIRTSFLHPGIPAPAAPPPCRTKRRKRFSALRRIPPAASSDYENILAMDFPNFPPDFQSQNHFLDLVPLPLQYFCFVFENPVQSSGFLNSKNARNPEKTLPGGGLSPNRTHDVWLRTVLLSAFVRAHALPIFMWFDIFMVPIFSLWLCFRDVALQHRNSLSRFTFLHHRLPPSSRRLRRKHFLSSPGATSYHENILTLVLSPHSHPALKHFPPAHPYRLRLFRKLYLLSDDPLSIQVLPTPHLSPRQYPLPEITVRPLSKHLFRLPRTSV